VCALIARATSAALKATEGDGVGDGIDEGDDGDVGTGNGGCEAEDSPMLVLMLIDENSDGDDVRDDGDNGDGSGDGAGVFGLVRPRVPLGGLSIVLFQFVIVLSACSPPPKR